MLVKSYLKEKISSQSMFTIFASFVGAVVALDYICRTYVSSTTIHPLLWAGTASLSFLLFFGLLQYCCFAQLSMQSEIDRMAVVKSRLESQILKKPQSSKKRNTKES